MRVSRRAVKVHQVVTEATRQDTGRIDSHARGWGATDRRRCQRTVIVPEDVRNRVDDKQADGWVKTATFDKGHSLLETHEQARGHETYITLQL